MHNIDSIRTLKTCFDFIRNGVDHFSIGRLLIWELNLEMNLNVPFQNHLIFTSPAVGELDVKEDKFHARTTYVPALKHHNYDFHTMAIFSHL